MLWAERLATYRPTDRIRLSVLKDRGYWGARSWPDEWESQGDDFLVPLVDDPDKLVLVVAGGRWRRPALLLVSCLVSHSASQRGYRDLKLSVNLFSFD